jgi:hypothetical protein
MAKPEVYAITSVTYRARAGLHDTEPDREKWENGGQPLP